MNYEQLKNYLIAEFEKHNFESMVKAGQKHAKKIYIRNKYNYDIKICFPGYKAAVYKGGIIYDYRLDFNNIPLSHVNILVDIHNKALQASKLREALYNFLVDLAKNALNVNLNKYEDLLQYKFERPSKELLERVKEFCEAKGKDYDPSANVRSYSINELALIIPYIVLQEDINYPMPRKQGRRMSFYRYVEAIFCTQNENHSLEEVIDRTISHTNPELWREFERKYIPIKKISR